MVIKFIWIVCKQKPTFKRDCKMHQATYKAYMGRLPTEEPLQICRICIQETQNLMSSIDPEWSEICSSYENITKLKVVEATKYPYFVCTECINMLREIAEFVDMVGIAAIFWKKYDKTSKRKPKNDEFSIRIDEGRSVAQTYFDSHPKEADAVFVQKSNELQLEDGAGDIEMNIMSEPSDVFFEINSTTTVVDLAIEGSCDICDEEFSSKEIFKNHVLAHERSFNCAHCGMSFKSKVCIIVHLKEIHNEGVATSPYKSTCTKCKIELSSKVCLRTHVQQYHGPEVEAKCPECNKIFGNLQKLRWHMPVHREKLFRCTQCPKTFRSQYFLNYHTVSHSNVKAFVCELCGIRLKTKVCLKTHIAGVHEMRKQKKYRRSIQCTLCEDIFPTLTVARQHFFKIHTENPAAAWKEFRSLCCGCCYIRFESTVQRQEHYNQYEALHDKSQQLMRNPKTKCERRPRNYVPWSQVIHPHKCDICKHTYKTPDSLKSHMRVHSKKPRPFKCEFCGSTHSDSTLLRQHIQRMHTNDRPFSCTECAYRCVTRTELKNHNKRNHNDKLL